MNDLTPPFEPSHDVDRWGGRHQDGPACAFKRTKASTGEMVVPKEGIPGMGRNVLDEPVRFGKHKGKVWRDVPVDYLEWQIANGHGKWRKYGKQAKRVLKAMEKERSV